MKYSNTLKLVTASIITASLLVGCSSNSTDNTSYVSNSGVAIDPELQGATVFLDINGNGILDADEPRTITGDDGSYSLAIEASLIGAPLVVVGGIDRVTKEDFLGTLSTYSSNDGTNLHITPLSTLVHQYKNANQDENIDDIRSKLATQLGINVSDLDANTVEVGNEELLKIALQIQMTAQGIADNSTDDISAIYLDIANELQTADLNTSLSNSCDNKILDNNFTVAKFKDLQHEFESLDLTALSAEQLALTMDNIDQNVTNATTQADLDLDLFNDETFIIRTQAEVQEQRKTRTFLAAGLEDLNATQKADLLILMENYGFDLEHDSMDDFDEMMNVDNLFDDGAEHTHMLDLMEAHDNEDDNTTSVDTNTTL